jgi:hypothetical protein
MPPILGLVNPGRVRSANIRVLTETLSRASFDSSYATHRATFVVILSAIPH